MEEVFQTFQNLKENHLIQTENPNLNETLYEFSFLLIKDDIQFDFMINPKKEGTIVIDECKYSDNTYMIICFKKTLVLINENNFESLKNFINANKESNFFTFRLETSKNILIKYCLNVVIIDSTIQDDTQAFQKKFLIKNKNLLNIWKRISKSICC